MTSGISKPRQRRRPVRKGLLWGTFVVLLVFTSVGRAGAQTYGAAVDFSLGSNPNGVWSYGFSSTPEGPLDTLYMETVISGDVEVWRENIGGTGAPLVLVNRGATLTSGTVVILAGQLVLHPGPQCQASFVRWTAPGNGVISIDAEFSGRDNYGPTNTSVRVLQNDTPLLLGTVDGFDAGSGPQLSTMLSVLTGDSIDYAVGCGSSGSYNFGSTALDATIAFTPTLDVDLTTSALSNPPATPPAGGPWTVTDTVRNDGTDAAGEFGIRYYLSTDAVRDTGDVLLLGARALPTLAASAVSTASTPLWLPPGIAAGTYYLLSCADDTDAVSETNELNNCRASSSTMRFRGPDLQMTALGNPPATLGATFAVSNTVRNTGGSGAATTIVRFYLSADTAPDGGDIAIATTRTVPALAAGGTSSATTTVTRPAAPAGLYYVIACADGANTVAEESETNNCRTTARTGRVP